MNYYFHPADENEFKNKASGNYVRTIVFDTVKEEVVTCFIRKVNKAWEQTCKNNIETDHRIKNLSGNNYQIYSWVAKSKNDFSLPIPMSNY